ncbi:hypothetical protein DFH06DRAFT_1150039 [Mycena polygramma]|nr:hypothetical protein DFH06DRAFT_1150039 [Mycena polygramma]
MRFFILALSCLLSFATASGVNVSAAAEPGFTWCDGANMTGRCVNAASAPNVCLNVIPSDNNKASSATANANSYCKLFDRYDCATNGAIVEIRAPAPVNLSSLGFDNKMGSFRCDWIAPVSDSLHTFHLLRWPTYSSSPLSSAMFTDTENGMEYGYINGTLAIWGGYGATQPTQAGALVVSFPEPTAESTRLNGPTSGLAYPFLGAKLNVLQNALGGTPDTAGEPGILSTDNSMSASFGERLGAFWAETAIWSYSRITQVLTAHWINSDGGQPETTIVLQIGGYDGNTKALALTGDIDAVRQEWRMFIQCPVVPNAAECGHNTFDRAKGFKKRLPNILPSINSLIFSLKASGVAGFGVYIGDAF